MTTAHDKHETWISLAESDRRVNAAVKEAVKEAFDEGYRQGQKEIREYLEDRARAANDGGKAQP